MQIQIGPRLRPDGFVVVFDFSRRQSETRQLCCPETEDEQQRAVRLKKRRYKRGISGYERRIPMRAKEKTAEDHSAVFSRHQQRLRDCFFRWRSLFLIFRRDFDSLILVLCDKYSSNNRVICLS